MKLKLVVFVLAASMLALAQGRPAGAGGGRPAGAGPQAGGSGAGAPSQAGRPEARPGRSAEGDARRSEAETRKQEGKEKGAAKREEHAKGEGKANLTDKETKSGAFKMLQRKTGKSEEELRAMYAASGARNFGQFVSGVVVAKNLDLDTGQVLGDMQEKSLGQILRERKGLSEEQARAEIRRAEREAREANRNNDRLRTAGPKN